MARRVARAEALFHRPRGGLSLSDVDAINRLEHAGHNIAKLLAADADERHLFLWINASQADAELAMHTGPPPQTPPPLPAGVDVLWVHNESGRLWRVRPPAGWEAPDP